MQLVHERPDDDLRAFLEQNPAASEAQVLDAMQNNYCRCGCYARIRKGVLRAAQLAVQPAGTA